MSAWFLDSELSTCSVYRRTKKTVVDEVSYAVTHWYTLHAGHLRGIEVLLRQRHKLQ